MDLELKHRVCLVTGGASGIGAATVSRLAGEGALPVILDRCERDRAEDLITSVYDAGGRAAFHQVDLTDEDATRDTIAEVIADRGGIDAVVNNAGVNDGIGLDADPVAFRESLERNLVQCFRVVHHSLAALRRSPQPAIVNIASKVALTGQGNTSGYAAAKGGLLALTREWALDLAADGIRVNAVVPAEVWTPMYEAWLDQQSDAKAAKREIEGRIPLGSRMTGPEEIADTVAFLLSPRASHTTGQILHVDGGYVHFDRAYQGSVNGER